MTMADEYGSDFLTIVDEDGKEYELEVLSTLEYNGATYLAVVPAGEPSHFRPRTFRSPRPTGEPE